MTRTTCLSTSKILLKENATNPLKQLPSQYITHRLQMKDTNVSNPSPYADNEHISSGFVKTPQTL